MIYNQYYNHFNMTSYENTDLDFSSNTNPNPNSSSYQLFSPLNPNILENSIIIDNNVYNIQMNISTLPPDYFKITKEELDKINKRKLLVSLSKIIEKYLIEHPKKMYNLTKYTLFEIDEIQADIFISIDTENDENTLDSELYYYKIISKNIYYELDDDDSISDEKTKDIVIYDNYGFDNIVSLLEDIKMVESTYKILDYYLLSPENMLEALAQREFIPIHPDKICSVCYESTIEYTICKHSICLKCREKCIVQGKKTCPICRNSNLSIYPITL